MSQNIVDFSGNPTGAGLMDDYLDKELQNILTSNSGIQRPSYAVAGTKWIDTSVTPWLLKMYDGTDDVVIGTINPSTHKFIASIPLTTTGDLIVQNEDGKPERLASGTAGTVLTSNGVGQVPSWQKSPYQTVDNLSQTLDDSTTKYPSNAAVKAVTDTKQDIATAVNYKNITNCITHIPQDIKLELKDGVLTLKAGSKLYKADSTSVVVAEDKSATGTNTTGICFYDIVNQSLEWRLLTECYSQNTAPTATQYMLWFDTANKIVKCTTDTGATWHECTLPTCIFTAGSTQITSIDQVFNGFGYIGSTVFALPGVKGLIPNGRNADGSLRNIEFTLNSVKTATRTWIDGDSIQVWGFCINPPAGMTETWYWNNYEESETEPSYIDYVIWYKPSENITYVNNQRGSKNWVKVNYINFGKAGGINSQEVKIFTPKTVFHALDYSDKSVISGWGMPSTKYIDLTFGATGTIYTAPANGYFAILKSATATKQYMQCRNAKTGMGLETHATSDNTALRQYIPAKKGDNVVFSYTAAGTLTFFRFIYAEGEN